MKDVPLLPPRHLSREQRAIWKHYFLTFRSLSILPSPLAYYLASRIGTGKSRRDPAATNEIARCMHQILPEITPDSAASNAEAYYRMEAREMMDVFFLPGITRKNLGRTITATGFETLQTGKKTGTIIAMAHFGRPIMLSTALGLSGFKVGMLSQPVDRRNVHLNPVEQDFLTLKMERTVAKAGGRWLTTLDNPRLLYRAMELDETIIIMLDVINPGIKSSFGSKFLGGELMIPTGIIRLMEKTGARLVYGTAIDEGRHVRAEIRPLHADTPEMAMQAAVSELENDTRAYPSQLWQWRTLHHVWRPFHSESAPG